MATSVDTESSFRHATPESLFSLEDINAYGAVRLREIDRIGGREWDVASGGDRFIFRMPRQVAGANQGLVFVQNWHQELLERVPVP